MGLLEAELIVPGLVPTYSNGPPATWQTHSVRMNFRPGRRASFWVCHSRSSGLSEPCPATWFLTTASLKWSTTAAMAKTPPSRSYRLCSLMSTVLCPPAARPDCHRDAL